MITPSVVTIVRVKKRPATRVSNVTLRKLQRESLRRESARWFVLELLAFGLLAALSVWPMIHAVEALRLL